jgi:Ca-activated chloride channel family protein
MAAELYRQQVRAGFGADTALLNLGTAALALDDSATAREALGLAAESLDPELRFRALYNLGLLNLRLAKHDSVNRNQYLDAARDQYREALLLKPGHADAKWNFELALRETPPESGGGGQQQQSPGSGGSSSAPQQEALGGLTREQAEQILNSMLEEERATRDAVNRRNARARTRVGSKE